MRYCNILEFLSEERPLIKVDRSFQRKSCWTLDQKRNFILSSLKKRTPYPIVLADIKTGLKKSKNLGKSKSAEMYQNLKTDYSYVSLDGQNRVTALEEFFNNGFQITGTLRGADGIDYPVSNSHYKDLPVRVKDAFDMLDIGVSVMKNCLYSELHTIFVDINDGEGLNPQEKRNAVMTWFSNYIRNIAEAEDNNKLLLRIKGISEQDIKRSADAEWYTKAFASMTRPNGHYFHHDGLDKFYKQGEGREQSSIRDYSQANINRFEEVLSMVYNSVFSKSNIGTPISHRLFWALLIATGDVYDTGRRILNYVSFFEAVKETDSLLCVDSQGHFATKHKAWLLNSSTVNNPEPTKSQYYFHWSGDVNSPSVRQKRKNALLNKLKTSSLYQESFKVQAQAAK